MVVRKKVKVIGIDLDGVIIDKPPFIPKALIEWLYRSHETKKISYRFPSDLEIQIRIFSHMQLLRPALKANVEFLKTLKRNGYVLYAISSRYSFLEEKTYRWIQTHGLNDVFTKVYLNTKNEQPHLFKRRMLSKIKVDLYIDDDKPLVRYLKAHCPTNPIALISGDSTIEKILKEKGLYK